ncbi:MAG TPA: hypothetical protein VHH36_02850 [Candidatus Thermoplasmatota archaeon]|nr:hypothetical protein [Candidatus Thermoplasmatota archaeon]
MVAARGLPRGRARVVREGDVTGYALLRRARRGFHLGPLVTQAGDLDAARALLADALAAARAWPVVALAPEGGGLLPSLSEEGFREVGRLLRMRTGTVPAPEAGATEWLVGGRITG